MTYPGMPNVAFLGALQGSPVSLSDTFNRANSADLGITPVGGVPWQVLSGVWDIYNNRLRNQSGTNPVVVLDARTPDVEISLDVSSSGRDAIVFRATDANNWLRLSNYFTSSTNAVTQYQKRCTTNSNCPGCSGIGCGPAATRCGSCPTVSGCCGSNCGIGHPPSGSVCQADWGGCTSTSSTACWTTSTTRRVYLHKMENGVLTTPHASYYNASTTSRLRVVANGSQLSIYSGSGTTLEATVTQAFNHSAELHGVGRSSLGNSGTAIDNFVLTPIEA